MLDGLLFLILLIAIGSPIAMVIDKLLEKYIDYRYEKMEKENE